MGPVVRTSRWVRATGLATLIGMLAATPAWATEQAPAPAAGAIDYAAAKRPPPAQPGGAPRPGRLPNAPAGVLPAPQVTHAFRMEPVLPSPRLACLVAARRAERVHGLPEGLLVAVALSESGLHAHALNISGRAFFPNSPGEARALLAAAPRDASVMTGCVQVNARVHARGADWPLDAERSADWAGDKLRRLHAATGSWTAAVARWHGGSPASTRRVLCRVRAKLEVAAPGSPLLTELGCAGSLARDRRAGAALLSLAEAVER